MKFIDTHSHLYAEYYPEQFDQVVQRAIAAHVDTILLPCVAADTIPHLLDAVEKYPDNLFPMIGLHPTEVKKDYREQLEVMERYLEDPRIIAVGEIGLDLYHDTTFIEEQKIAFQQQLEWGRDLNLPFSIHIRDAYNEAIAILKKYRWDSFSGVLHCFSGGIQEARWAIDHGFLLGIAGPVTFKNSRLQEIVKEIGVEHIVLETDAPFLAPMPYRGKRNESAYIPLIAEKIAEISGLTLEEVARITRKNAKAVFYKLP
ncbi:MAG TPA: TatD family hydrolase [Bacteroidales bacterium]|jgi:TatD DNase family protein|nr:TatD family hydrolase [Bacteroidales bacterium]